MKFNIKTICLSVGVASTLLFGACNDNIDPLIEELDFNRVFSPVDLTAKIRNRTTVELNWDVVNNVEKYVIEIAEDSMQFQTIVRTIEVNGSQVPYSLALLGETQYSARIKGVIEGKEDSKWSAVAFKTDTENIFKTIVADDIKATSVRLSWPAASEVTHLLLTPGDIRHDLSSEEIAAGEATVDELTGETNYTAKLYLNTKVRGTATFRTTVDLGNAIGVYPADDLKTILETAQAGAVFALFPGDYGAWQGKITISQSISIKGVRPNDKPVLHNQFILAGNNLSVEFRDLVAIGDGKDELGVANTDHFIQVATSGVTEVDTIRVEGCDISDYPKSLMAASSGAFKVSAVVFHNCVVSDVLTSGADFIDFRASACASLTLSNSTFSNCAPARDFIRMDNATAYADVNPAILIDRCTFYKVSDPAKRLLYVRKAGNTSTVQRSIIAETTGYYSNQAATTQPVCDKNNYFNALDYLPASAVANVKTDQSGSYTEVDPGFAAPATGNFKVSHQTLIDNGIGDPRWLQ